MHSQMPEGFKNMLQELLGKEEAGKLIAALEEEPVTAVRLNVRKLVDQTENHVAEFEDTETVAWCKSGFYLKERPEFILDPLLHAGAYYVQDASSMIYQTVIEKLIWQFQESTGKGKYGEIPYLRVLDMCAAPGGKTTAMINALPDGCDVTANEYSAKRVGALRENLAKWGYPNVTVTNKDSAFYGDQGEAFDIVAVDAPCSGEGMMRKEEVARTQWSLELVEQCSVLQREILDNAMKALKPGGFLIYSTCTFNHKENEENAEYINKELGLTPFNLEFSEEWGIMKGINTDLPVYRFMPHVTRGEGLFLAVFRKPGEWLASKRKTIIDVPREEYPKVEVDKSMALAYLRRESIKLPDESPLGMVTITYKGLPLGPAKNIGTRANNLYPKNWRILKR